MSTIWHITFGTYGARLHGGDRPTVDRNHNVLSQPYIPPNARRARFEQNRMRDETVYLQSRERAFIEATIPELCERGGWHFHACAAELNHIHVLLKADSRVHGKRIRALLKRWLTQALNQRLGQRRTWWAEGGSNRVIHDVAYLENAKGYVCAQGIMNREQP